MGSGAPPKDALEYMITDCIIFGLTESKAVEYIKQRTDGYEIPLSRYYEIKKEINSNPYLKAWIEDFARIGFVIKFRERLDEIERLQKDAWENYRKLKEMELTPKLLPLIFEAQNQIRTNSRMLCELYCSVPIIAQIKAYVDSKDRPELQITPESPQPQL